MKDDMKMDNMNVPHDKINHDMSSMKMDHNDHNDMDHMQMSDMDMSGMHGDNTMHMDMGDMYRRFWWSLALMIPIILFAPFMGMPLPFTITFPGSTWVVAFLSIILYIVGTKPFFSMAKDELRQKKPAMMSLISMGLIVTFWASMYAFVANTFFHTAIADYFWEFATLVVIMLLGHVIEMSATMKAGDATADLRKLMPATAHVQHGNTFMDMPISSLKRNMVVQVLAGEAFPGDGQVQSGNSQVDESLMTGESKPIRKATNDKVIGGTINGNGTLLVQLSAVGSDSFIGQLQSTLQASQSEKSQAESIASRVASWLFWFALAFALIGLIVWTPIKGLTFAINIAVTTLVIACPHALGLAIPLVIQRTKSIAATDGILIKNQKNVLMVKQLRYALMDKTGTLTDGHFTVQNLVVDGIDQNQALAIMAGLEKQSTHPLAQSIVAYVQKQKVPAAQMTDVQNLTGFGVQGRLDNQTYSLVSARYLDHQKIAYQALDNIGSVSYLTDGQTVLAAIAQGDRVKPTAPDFIKELLAERIQPVLVTGDNRQTANRIAKELGITEVNAEVSPQDKINLVKTYQGKGQVMMIGDGINDAPALAQANLSIAIGAGTHVAQSSADAVLISKNLQKVIDLIHLAHNANRKQIENLWWGAGYNLIAIPAAAGVFSFIGITLNPMIGAIVMSLSTVIVAANAFLLHK